MSGSQSHSEHFFKHFQHETTSIQEQVDHLESPTLNQSERRVGADQCLARITRLAAELADASGDLPSYDQRTYNQSIKNIQDKLVQIQSTLAPRAKFSFKSKKNASGLLASEASGFAPSIERHSAIPGYLTPGGSVGSPSSSRSATPAHLRTPDEDKQFNAPVPSAPSPPIRHNDETSTLEDPDRSGSNRHLRRNSQERDRISSPYEPHSLSIRDRKNEYLALSSAASSLQEHLNQACTISSLDTTILNLSTTHESGASFSEHLASLTLTNTQTSLLLLTRPVAGPAHITGVRNSIILLSCRQFRMHDCENVDVYLFCLSRPIIEGCHGIRFQRMPDFLFDLIHQPPTDTTTRDEQTRPKRENNMFDQIDDFKWLKAEQSPNWSLMSTNEGITETKWKELISLHPDTDVSQILDYVGLVNSKS